MNTLSRLKIYMTGREMLFSLSLFLSGLSALSGMAPFVLVWFIIREFLIGKNDSSLLSVQTYALLATGFAVASVLFYFAALSLSHLAAFRAETNIRRRAMKKMVNLPLGFFENNTIGRIRKIIDDNASITHSFLAHQLPDFASTVVMPITAGILIFVFDWRLGVACLLPIVFSMTIMFFMMGKTGQEFMKMYMDSLEDMNTEAVEYVRGIPVVKVFQQTVFSFKNFYNSIIRYKKMVIKFTNLWQRPMSLYIVLINGFSFFIVPTAILLISHSGNLSLTILNMFLYILIAPVFSQSIIRSMRINHAFWQAREAVDRLDNLLSVDPLPTSQNPKSISKFDITFKNVSFSYLKSGAKVINNISFDIPQNKTVALVGASGGGKSTIAKLVPRFWDVDDGEIFIGGENVKNIPHKELMKNISFVFQNTKLFKTTLLENIKYGNHNATLDEVNQAVDMAQCKEIIDNLPNGLNTQIGTKGTYLSGGEQQRIVLARAILKDAPIVVLDEATAFTDPENEHLIQKALGVLAKGKTVLMIAHRLTSVQNADNILVINNGKIAEQGNHEELLKQNGIYLKMWNEYQKSVQWTIGKEACNA